MTVISLLIALLLSAPQYESSIVLSGGTLTYCEDKTGMCIFESIALRIEEINGEYEALLNNEPVEQSFYVLPRYLLHSVELLKSGYADTVSLFGDDSVIIEGQEIKKISFNAYDTHYEFIPDSLVF